jgi:hypothetical protein
MMVNEDTIIEVLQLFRGVGLKGTPPEEDARHWVRVLADVPAVLLHMAAEHYLRTPEDDKGKLKGRRFCPSAAELRNIAFNLESTHRAEVKQTRRGCLRCGELVDKDGSITEHGTGFRTLVQHCHPEVNGAVDWNAAPYRIGQRRVLCDCEKGQWIAHQHQTMDRATLPHHIAKEWQPTLTVDQAWDAFQRHDARVYVTGSDHRLHHHDRRPGSPWFTRPSPEETDGDNQRAADVRALCYRVIKGEVDPRTRMPVKLQS